MNATFRKSKCKLVPTFQPALNHEESSSAQFRLFDEEGAEEGKKHNSGQKAESFVSRPTITMTDNASHIRIQTFNVVEAFPHSVDDFIDVLAVLQIDSKLFSQKLLNNCR